MRIEMSEIETITYKPIGIVHSPKKAIKGMPIQAVAAEHIEGTLEIFPEFTEGLTDIEGFSHLIVVSHFHLSNKGKLMVKPYMDDNLHGVFATHSPNHPNPIGISIVKLNRVEHNILHISDLDMLDGTPILDIKPFVPQFEERENVKIGWLENNIHKLFTAKDDERFA